MAPRATPSDQDRPRHILVADEDACYNERLTLARHIYAALHGRVIGGAAFVNADLAALLSLPTACLEGLLDRTASLDSGTAVKMLDDIHGLKCLAGHFLQQQQHGTIPGGVSRSDRARAVVLARDGARCIVTGCRGAEVCPIVPLAWSDSIASRVRTDRRLACLGRFMTTDELGDLRDQLLVSDGCADEPWNLVCLTDEMRRLWAAGLWAFEFIDDDSRGVVTLRFHWMKRPPRLHRYAPGTLVTWDNGGPRLHRALRDVMSCHWPVTGDIFHVALGEDDAAKFSRMVQLQWYLVRVASMSGAAGFCPVDEPPVPPGAEITIDPHAAPPLLAEPVDWSQVMAQSQPQGPLSDVLERHVVVDYEDRPGHIPVVDEFYDQRLVMARDLCYLLSSRNFGPASFVNGDVAALINLPAMQLQFLIELAWKADPATVQSIAHAVCSVRTLVCHFLQQEPDDDNGPREPEAFLRPTALPGTPPSQAASGPSSVPSSTGHSRAGQGRRSSESKHACLIRDGRQCIVTKSRLVEVCHIIPFAWNDTREHRRQSSMRLACLRMLVEDHVFNSIMYQLVAKGSLDKAWNLVCLSPDVRTLWSMGLCAFEVMDDDAENGQLEVEGKRIVTLRFHYMKVQPRHILPNAFADWSQGGPQLHRTLEDPDNVVHNREMGRAIMTGDVFCVAMDPEDASKFVLVMRLQWYLIRVASMSGISGERDNSGDEGGSDEDSSDDSRLYRGRYDEAS